MMRKLLTATVAAVAITGFSLSVWANELPSGYAKQDYIESSGEQYILTDFTPNSQMQISATFRLKSLGNNRNYVFGCYNSGSNGRCQFSYGATVVFGYGSTFDDSIKVTEDLAVHTMAISTAENKAIFNLDGVDKRTGVSWGGTGIPLCLFGSNSNGTIGNLSSIRLYSFNVAKAGVPVMKLVPAKETASGKYGFYDLVGKRFLGNSATSGADFIGGKDSESGSALTCYTYMTVTSGSRVITDYKPSGLGGIDLRYSPSTSSGNSCLLCSRVTSSGSVSSPWYDYFAHVNSQPRFDYYSLSYVNGVNAKSEEYEFVFADGVGKIFHDGVQVGSDLEPSPIVDFRPSFPLALFQSYTTSGTTLNDWANPYVGKFSYLALTEGGEVVHEFYPCVEDGVVKLYDRTTDLTYFNGNGKLNNFSVSGAEIVPFGPEIGAIVATSTSATSFDVRLDMVTACTSFTVEAVPASGSKVSVSGGAIAAGESATVALSGLAADTCYELKVSAMGEGGTSETWGNAIYTGEISIAKGDDAEVEDLVPGTFVITRGDSAAATSCELIVNYTVSGTPGSYEELLGVVTIPAGMSSVTVFVTPKFSEEIKDDVDLSLALAAGQYAVGEDSSATIRIKAATSSPFIRYVAESGDDANDGRTIEKAKATLQAAIDDLDSVSTAYDCTVYVDKGTYVQPVNVAKQFCVYVTNRVSVVGMTGDPADVCITRDPTAYAIFCVNNAGARLQGLTISDGRLTEGRTTGGGVFITAGAVEDCIVSNCTGTAWGYSGQGIYAESGARISRCRIVKCAASSGANGQNGAGIYLDGGLVEDTLVTGCTCNDAGAIFLTGAAKAVNCTVVGNTGTGNAGVKVSGSSAAVANCAIFGNVTPNSNTGSVYSSAAGKCFFNCAADCEIAGGTDCIVCQPAFRDFAAGDYHPTAASAFLGRGCSRATYGTVSVNDLDGVVRKTEAVDIGCYEYVTGGTDLAFTWSVNRRTLPVTVSLTAKSVGLESPEYSWTLHNVTTGADKIASGKICVIELGDGDAGTYEISVAAGGLTYTAFEELQVSPVDLYVRADSSGGTFPYESMETAAMDVQTAVTAAAPGATVHVAVGTYPVSKPIQVYKSVSVVGMGKRYTETVVTNTANTSTSRVFLLQDQDALLANLHITGGRTSSNPGGNIYIYGKGGTVSNCLISAGLAKAGWGEGAGAAYLLAGTLTHCEITCCNAVPNGSGTPRIIALSGSAARMSNCFIHDCYSDWLCGATEQSGSLINMGAGSTMENCTLVNSTTYKNAAAVYTDVAQTSQSGSAHVRNCAIFATKLEDGSWAAVSGGTAWETYWPNYCYFNCAVPTEVKYTSNTKTYYGNNCVTGVTAEVCFVDPAHGDFRPLGGGKLVNMGMNEVSELDTDFANHRRVVKGIVDIGCYEYGTRGIKLIIR